MALDIAGFGAALRRLRLEVGLSQEELAERGGVSARAVSALERGVNRRPQRATLEALLAALGPPSDTAALRAAARHAKPSEAVATGPEFRYATSGEVSIAYQVEGGGPPDLILVPGLVSHLEQNRQWPGAARLLGRLSGASRLIRFDKRGTGLSDRVAGVPDLEDRMDDVRAVMDAAGSVRAVVVGQSEGGSMSLLFAATYPGRTIGLVLHGACTCIGAPDRPPGPLVLAAEEERREAEDVRARYGSRQYTDERLARYAPSMEGDERYRTYWANFLRQGASPGAYLTLARMNRRIDVRDLLSSIHVPTLILHRVGDRVVSVEHARFMARHIPGAELVELPGDDHIPYVGDTEALAGAIERFLAGLGPAAEYERVLTTVLAVAGSRAGDRIAANGVLRHYRGRELPGGGEHVVLAAFEGPGRAVRCGAALLATMGSAARAVVQIGECEVVGSARVGPAVDGAMAAARAATAGELLVSGAVRDLVSDPGLRFRERRPLPGAPGPLFAVTVT